MSTDHSPAQATTRTLPRHATLGAAVVDASGGVKISAVLAGSAAQRADLHVGDIVTLIGGTGVNTPAEFVSRVKQQPAGIAVRFAVKRADVPLSIDVVLSAAPDESDPGVRTSYETVDVDGSLRRTLIALPDGARGRHPAVLIVGGIGCFSVDNARDAQDAYMRLAHDLSRKGFIVMRLEKSGIGDSQGPPCLTVDLMSEMHSYELALRVLQRDPRVASGHVYLLGHSIGTTIAPRLAEQVTVAGVIAAEGVGRNWIEYELANLRRQLELDGEPAEKIDAAMSAKEVCMHRLLVAKELETDIERTAPECKVHNAYPAPASYMQEAAALNIAEPWSKLSVPLLAVYGTADFVTEEADHRRIVDIVNAHHPGLATLQLVPGMDHHLDAAGTQQQAYDLRVKHQGSGPYEPKLSATILGWLCDRERCT